MALTPITISVLQFLIRSLFRGLILFISWNWVIAVELKLTLISYPLSMTIAALTMALLSSSQSTKIIVLLNNIINLLAAEQLIRLNGEKLANIATTLDKFEDNQKNDDKIA